MTRRYSVRCNTFVNNELDCRVRFSKLSSVSALSHFSRTFALTREFVPIRPRTLMTCFNTWRASVTAALMFVSAFGAAHAQDSATGFQAKRADLQNRAGALETELADPKLSSSKKKAAQSELTLVRNRLANGDFKTGDLLVITVNVEEKPTVDTATVRDNGMISIQRVPDISVAGTLRSEVLDKVKAHVETYFRTVDVRVNFSTRLIVSGAVARGGPINVSPDRPLSEVITIAGGAAPNAKLDQMEVKRAGRTIISTKDSKRLLIEGRTIEQVGIQNGDEVVIPGKRRWNWQTITQTLLLLSSLTFALISFLSYLYSDE
ncbi:MAG: polysaccharide biosynthesis/export family protein [Gemmatimonas sp.]